MNQSINQSINQSVNYWKITCQIGRCTTCMSSLYTLVWSAPGRLVYNRPGSPPAPPGPHPAGPRQRTLGDAAVLQWGADHNNQTLSVTPPTQFCINNTDATLVVYFCPQRQYKLCVNTLVLSMF